MAAISILQVDKPLIKVYTVIRNTLVAIWCGIIAAGEIAGRSRAAAELTRQGYHEEAKALMMELKQLRGEK